MNAPRLHAVQHDDEDDYYGDIGVYGEALKRDSAVRSYLEPLKKHLADAGATELWINKPGEIIIESGVEIKVIEDPTLTFEHLMAFAKAIAVYSPQQQEIGDSCPILSSTLPDGERVQIVLPPCVEPGTVSFSIRVPNESIIPLATYQSQGAFDNYLWPRPADAESDAGGLSKVDRELAELLLLGRLDLFITEAIKARKNIAVVGDTGSGKTTLMKSMCQVIPARERLITIEDVRELNLPGHYNRVHLLYSKGGQGAAKVLPADLIASCMRMTPSRALLAELRGMEAWDFLKLLSTGHSGSITSFHAESCALAFQRFMFMVKEHPDAATSSRDELNQLIALTLDVVIHVKREVVFDENNNPVKVVRYVDEVFYDPWAKRNARFGSKVAEQVRPSETSHGSAL